MKVLFSAGNPIMAGGPRDATSRPLPHPSLPAANSSVRSWLANDRNRRISLVAVRPGEGRLTEPTAAVQPWRQELVLMPRSCRSQWRPRVAELGGRLGAKVVSHVCYIPSRWLRSQCRGRCLPSLIARLRAPVSLAESGAGVRCEATREEVFLDGGSTACRARRAVSRLAQDTYRRDPGRTIAGRSRG
jgi:hypothetical protein